MSTDFLYAAATVGGAVFAVWYLWNLCWGVVPFTAKAKAKKERKTVLTAARTFILSYEDLPAYRDGPFGAYQVSDDEGFRNALRLIKEGDADGVKLEGGERCVPLIRRLVEAGIPVCGHLGLTPQSCLAMGGFKVQGREAEAAKRLIEEAKLLASAGCFCLVVEGVPAALGTAITKAVSIPVIGIGAGAQTDGQILVWQDLLGLNIGHVPKFARTFANLGETIQGALRAYAGEVAAHTFPAEAESYQ